MPAWHEPVLAHASATVLEDKVTHCRLFAQVYKVTESALADILAAFQSSYNDLDDKLKQAETAYDAFTASQFGNFGGPSHNWPL